VHIEALNHHLAKRRKIRLARQGTAERKSDGAAGLARPKWPYLASAER